MIKEESEIEYKAIHFLNENRVGITEDILRAILNTDFEDHAIEAIIIDFKAKKRYHLENGEIKILPNGEKRHQEFATIIQNKRNEIERQDSLLRDNKTMHVINPTPKEIKQNPIVDIFNKYWWAFVVPLIVGVILLCIEKCSK